MSFNRVAPLGSVSERSAALRAQYEADQRYAAQKTQENAMKDKSPAGIVRSKPDADRARDAIGALNQKLDEALDEVRVAFEREAMASRAEGITRAEDSKRAPALDGRMSS